MPKKPLFVLIATTVLVNILSCILLAAILNESFISVVSYCNLDEEKSKALSSIPLAANQVVNDQVEQIENGYISYEWRIKIDYEDKIGIFWCNDIQTKYAYLQKPEVACLADNDEWYKASVGEWCRPEEGEWFIVEPSDLKWYNAEPKLQLFDCAGYAPPMMTIQNIKTYSFIRASLYLEEIREGNSWW